MYTDTGTHEHARLKTLTPSHRQGYRIRSEWKDQRLWCGVFKFLILVLCLNHRVSTNPPRGCHLFLSDTPFNPLGMVLSKFHSQDNVILQICAYAPVFFRLHFSCCLDLRGEAEGRVRTSNLAVQWCRCCSPGRCGDSELHQPWLAGQIPFYLLIEYSSLNKGIGVRLHP